jgi:hypothetical protein
MPRMRLRVPEERARNLHEPVWVSPGRLAGHDLRFYAAAAGLEGKADMR